MTRHCTVCGRNGHEAAACFRVIGYPDWYGDKNHAKNTPVGRGRGTTPRANSTQIVSANSMALASNASVTDKDRQGLAGITDEQWQLIQ